MSLNISCHNLWNSKFPVSPQCQMSDQEPEKIETAEAAIVIEDTREIDCFECRSCGYTYEPERGDPKGGIAAGTPFDDISIVWRCPVCSAKKSAFNNIGPKYKASGFKENLGYGFGVNTMTPSQKNVLIFTALALGIVFFLSLYTLN
jgi:rubredoxin